MLFLISFFFYFKLISSIEIFTEFVSLNFTWDSSHRYEEYLSTGQFVPTHCKNLSPFISLHFFLIPLLGTLAGIKVDKHSNIYVTVPRWLDGVPATLNKLKKVDNQYLLSPYPSWDMQTVGISGELQNCQSMVLDSNGLMFVIEVGRRNFYEVNPLKVVNGPPGVWIINTETSEIISQYYFPPSVASPNNSFVNDIVIDEKKQIAYLTDAWGLGGLIIYNYQLGTSRRYSGPSTANDPNYVMIINGVNYGTTQFTTPIDGIAITNDLKAIFYCAVQGVQLYRIPTSILNDFTTSTDQITASIQVIPGTKEPSDGIMYWNNALYYGSLPESTYYALEISSTSSPDLSQSVPTWPDQVNMRWVRIYLFVVFISNVKN